MNEVLDLVPILIVIVGIIVFPTLIMLRVTRGYRAKHPVIGAVIALLPSFVILLGMIESMRFIAKAPFPKESAPFPSEPTAGPPPRFPWPPPSPSARLVIARPTFVNSRTFGQFADYLEQALASAGYSETSYYSVPGGMAVVTRLEHIHADGTPVSATRWVVNSHQVLSLSDYIRSLFGVDEGYYRVVVFVVTDQPFGSTDQTVTSDDATRWLNEGYNTLPETFREEPLTANDTCTALIYEFQKDHGASPRLLIPSPLGAREHLIASGLLPALTTPSRSR